MNKDMDSKEISPMVIAEVFKTILSMKRYKMSSILATTTYSAICRRLGLVPSKLKLEEDDGETGNEVGNKDVRGSPQS